MEEEKDEQEEEGKEEKMSKRRRGGEGSHTVKAGMIHLSQPHVRHSYICTYTYVMHFNPSFLSQTCQRQIPGCCLQMTTGGASERSCLK